MFTSFKVSPTANGFFDISLALVSLEIIFETVKLVIVLLLPLKLPMNGYLVVPIGGNE